jgi:ubiquinone/menaquinone biosynthesis C-methylase UbiE
MRNCYVEPGIPCTSQHDTTVKKRLNYILGSITIDKNQIFLDIGTGFGTYIYHSSNHAKLYVGIDINGENLRKAIKKKENVELITMSAENLAFRDNTFDAVLMIEVLEHVLDDEKAISDIYRILKPGGKLIITAPNKLFPFETHGFRIGSKGYGTKGLGFPVLPYLPEILRKYMANARVYTPWHLKRMLVEEGFSINDVGFLSPGLDQLRINFPKLGRSIEHFQRLIDIIEKVPILNAFLTTIIVCAEKVRKI